MLLDTGRRKIVKGDGEPINLTVIDELAYYTATVGTKAEREKFTTRPAGLRRPGPQVRAPVRPGHPAPLVRHRSASLRDLFGYRWAFRCATDDSSDVVLGKGAAKSGYTAAAIPDQARGVGLLRAEGKRIPRRVKAAYLSDDELRRIAARAAILRGRHDRLDDDRQVGHGRRAVTRGIGSRRSRRVRRVRPPALWHGDADGTGAVPASAAPAAPSLTLPAVMPTRRDLRALRQAAGGDALVLDDTAFSRTGNASSPPPTPAPAPSGCAAASPPSTWPPARPPPPTPPTPNRATCCTSRAATAASPPAPPARPSTSATPASSSAPA